MEIQPHDNDFAPFPAGTIPADRSDWIGTWTIERGSLRGELTIHGFVDLHLTRRVTYVRASYVAADGTFVPVNASLDPADPYRMKIAIGFAARCDALELFCFRTNGGNAESAALWYSTRTAIVATP